MEDDREAELEAGRMPLLDHLIELRNRLMWSIGAIMVAFLVCYHFKERIYGFLVHPLAVIFAGHRTPSDVRPAQVQALDGEALHRVGKLHRRDAVRPEQAAPPERREHLGQLHRIHALAFARDGRLAASRGNVVQVWTPHRLMSSPSPSQSHIANSALTFGPDGRLVTGALGGNARIWDQDLKTSKRISGPGGPIAALAVVPDGHLAIGAYVVTAPRVARGWQCV